MSLSRTLPNTKQLFTVFTDSVARSFRGIVRSFRGLARGFRGPNIVKVLFNCNDELKGQLNLHQQEKSENQPNYHISIKISDCQTVKICEEFLFLSIILIHFDFRIGNMQSTSTPRLQVSKSFIGDYNKLDIACLPNFFIEKCMDWSLVSWLGSG